ncbi:hypothetical protein GYMLUDRAFT_58379 [Collybiopsis luxurians FD-317 M1]|uniref:Uncharacterized protein n=1 Tax=Collybiopsis luxurians FD-317 M1 TaxID=944289 RepID=A0A0D0CS92_9AGAR|nr:hypothetical protein GYMLUDRAFT_58379 [Collybiopsis luxurians FD-317 M1]
MPWKTAAYQSPFATAHTSVMAAKNGLPTLDSKQREIAKLELEISVQRAKLPTVRPNNIKQIQRSIATREAKVASLRQEILGVELNGSSSEASQDGQFIGFLRSNFTQNGPEICTKDTGGTLLIHITNKQSYSNSNNICCEASSVAEQADEINPEGVGDIASDSVATDPKGILQRELIVSDYGQGLYETGVLSGEKTASILEAASEGSTIQESTSKSRGTKPLPVELIAAPVSPVIEQLNAASPIASTATETASMLYEPQGPPSGGSEHGGKHPSPLFVSVLNFEADHHNFMANNHQGSSSLTGALGVTSGGSDVLNPGVPRLRLSLNSHRLQEEVAELLDASRLVPAEFLLVKTYKSSHQSARRYSGESLSPGAKALMIGWRYTRHWRDFHSGCPSSDPYLDSTPATDQPSLSHVTPAPTTSINENLGFHPSAFLINPFQGSANVHHNHPRPLSVASIPNKSPEPTEENQSHASQPSVNQAPTSIEVKTHQSHQQAENAQSVILPHSGSNVISPLNTEDNVVQIEQQAPSVPPTTKHAVSSPNTGEQLCSEPLSSDALLQSRILSNSGQSPDAQDSVKRSTSTYELPPNPSTHEPPPNPSTHELPPNPVDAPPSSLPTMENCLVPAPI